MICVICGRHAQFTRPGGDPACGYHRASVTHPPGWPGVRTAWDRLAQTVVWMEGSAYARDRRTAKRMLRQLGA